MRIGEVARRLDIPISTIRYYERKQIIPKPKRSGNVRSYSEGDIRIISFVRKSQAVGLSLTEIAGLLGQTAGNDTFGLRIEEMVQTKRKYIAEQIVALHEIDEIFVSMEKCGCATFQECTFSDDFSNSSDTGTCVR